MKKLRIGIIELLANSPANSMYARIMRVNSASIMPQVIAVWLEQAGHEVFLTHYSGYKNLYEDIPEDVDLVIFSAFTTSAIVAYALSNYFRTKGIPTALGGPHARSYPEDSSKYFDYVFGFANRDLVEEVVKEHCLHKPGELGDYVSSDHHPEGLPGVQERWEHIERMLQKAPYLKIVPMIGSLGCAYTCSFCIDSVVPYQPLSYEKIKEDLRFLRTKFRKPIVGWHDPNFAIRFDDYLSAIEEAVPQGSIRFIAESSLALLGEENVKRLKKNGFVAMLPGIESWFDLGIKSRMRKIVGMEKVERVAEKINMIQEYIPYVQGNFVLGLDSDEGSGPFELTKEFIDRCPGIFPTYNMLTAYGRSVPLNLEYQSEGRMVPFPFSLLNNDSAMNVRPKNYEWVDFFTHLKDLFDYTYSNRAIARRFLNNRGITVKMLNYFRANTQGKRHARYYGKIIEMLKTDRQFRAFFEQETTEVPPFFADSIMQTLGPLAEWLPDGGLQHDAYAYLNAVNSGIDKRYQAANVS
ncbi:MAG TPA: radical SAM protein [Balneolaceae bacterium]|nr:radical SAM protein [Balneolaceae bacterium]